MKPVKINKNDKIAIISLSSGIMGEPFIKHEVDIALKRINQMGYTPVFTNNAMKGLDCLKNNPKLKADDIYEAFSDKSIKAIFCAIGGFDAYTAIPYIMENKNLLQAIKNNPKIFLGFSDSTTNHLLFYKLGLNTFYGQSVLADIAELDNDMLPYSKYCLLNLLNGFNDRTIFLCDTWYEDRLDYSPAQIGIARTSHKEQHGSELYNITNDCEGILFGGCLDVIYEYLNPEHPAYMLNQQYNLVPTTKSFYKDKLLFIETSDSKPQPHDFEKMIKALISNNILDNVKGVIFGKPCDEKYYDEYKEILLKYVHKPLLFNLNFGHAQPHAIIPYGVKAKINYETKNIDILENVFE